MFLVLKKKTEVKKIIVFFLAQSLILTWSFLIIQIKFELQPNQFNYIEM